MIMATYRCMNGHKSITIFLCPEHPEWVRKKSIPWFTRRGMLMPARCGDIIATLYRQKVPMTALIDESGQYADVIEETFLTPPRW
jgi:hypothetical protein